MKAFPTLRKWLAPLVFFQTYLTVTVILFFAGPWPWNIANSLEVTAYLVAAQLFILAGYLLAWPRIGRAAARAPYFPCEPTERGVKFLKWALAMTFVLMVPTSLSRTFNWFPDVVAGLGAPGDVYSGALERLSLGGQYVVFEYVRMLFSPLLIGVFPLTIVYWSKISWFVRLVGVAAIAFNLSLYVATGTNKGLADFVVTLPWLLYFAVSVRTMRIPINKYLLIGLLAFLFWTFLQFFGASQLQRAGGVGERGVFNTGFDLMYADPNNGLAAFLPADLQIIFESITRYLGQGYYALSMTLGLDHESTLGFGNSMFLARNADALLGTTQFSEGSLPGILEAQTGWGMFALWHSIYPWLASDFGFFGTLFLMGVFAYLLALSWGMSLITMAPEWIVLTYLMLLLFFYIPANNQIFQTGETLVAFFLLVLFLGGRGVAAALRTPAGPLTESPPVATSR